MEIYNENSSPADDQEASEGEGSEEGEESEQENENDNVEAEVQNEPPVASAPPVDTELENLYQMFPNMDKTIVNDMYRMSQGDTGMAAQQLLEIQGDGDEQPNSSPPMQDNAPNVPTAGQNENRGNFDA